MALPRPEVWAGVECARVHMGSWTVDQLSATGHADRIGDIDLLASLGVSAVRYPVLWGRHRGANRDTDWEWARERLGALSARRIRPVVGLLHHGWGPKRGSALDDGFVDAFGAFAGKVARRFPEVDAYLPINEPLTTARFAGLYGWWPPYAADDGVFVRLLVAQCLAIRAASRQIRRIRPDATVIVTEDGGTTYGSARLREQIEFDNERRWLTFDLLTGRVGREHPLWAYLWAVKRARRGLASLRDDPEPPSVLGVDYYVTSDRYLDHRVELYPPAVRGGNGWTAYADVELVRVGGYDIAGFARVIRETWLRYRLPIALTEVDLAGEEEDKIAWWVEAWMAAADAAQAGIPVQGVTAWSVFGAVDWRSTLRSDEGHYEPGAFDARVSPPRLTSVGRLIARTAASRAVATPIPTGWWRRPDRALYRGGLSRSRKRAAEQLDCVPAHHPFDHGYREARS